MPMIDLPGWMVIRNSTRQIQHLCARHAGELADVLCAAMDASAEVVAYPLDRRLENAFMLVLGSNASTLTFFTREHVFVRVERASGEDA